MSYETDVTDVGKNTASETFIPAHGGYAGLLAYRKALVVFQGMVRFCKRFLEKRDRTVDQMIQAARSGKQNIVEGSKVSGTSKEAEIKLINVARASLEELPEDYRDFLRVRKAQLWTKDSREALFVRKLGAKKDVSYRTYETYIETRPPEVIAKYPGLPHSSNQLPARPAHPQTGEGICGGGRPARTYDTRPVGGAGKTEEVLKSIRGSVNSQKPTLQRIAKSSSRYYGTDVVHSTNAKEKFRWFTPLQSSGSG